MTAKPQPVAEAGASTPKSLAARVTPRGWWTLAVLTAIYVFASMDRVALSVLLQPIKLEFHLNDQELGLLSGLAFAIFHSAFGIPLARVADRYTRVKLIAACTATWSVMMALTGRAQNFTQLFLCRVGVGIGEAGCVPASHSLIGEYFTRERRTLAVSFYQTGALLGASGGLFLVGLLGQQLGWRASLQIIGLAGVPLALLAVLTLREGSRTSASPPPVESARTALGALLSRPAFVHIALANGLGSLCTFGLASWTPTFMIRSFGFTLAQAGGWVGLVSALAGGAGLIGGGFISTGLMRRDPRWEVWLPALGYSISIPLFIASLLNPSPWISLEIRVFAQFFAAIAGGVGFAAMHSFSEPFRRATAISLVMVLISLLGNGFGPYLIGVASDMLEPAFGKESLRYAMALSLVVLAWSVVHYLLAARRHAKDRVN
jgi:MFS family permease